MKAGHRLQQEHRDKSSLFSPPEFAESANWICCLLFCFRWAVVFPWKMPLFHLQVWTTLSPDYYHWFLDSHGTVGQPCLVLFVLLHDRSTYTVLCSHICTSQRALCLCPEQFPVTEEMPSAGAELLENHWELVASQSCCWAVQAAQNQSHNQLPSSSNLFVLLAVLCTY